LENGFERKEKKLIKYRDLINNLKLSCYQRNNNYLLNQHTTVLFFTLFENSRVVSKYFSIFSRCRQDLDSCSRQLSPFATSLRSCVSFDYNLIDYKRLCNCEIYQVRVTNVISKYFILTVTR
jgi:hypothetical protein